MWLPKRFQYAILFAMIEKWRNNMDKGKSRAALLTDLNKAKLEAHNFSYEALKVILPYRWEI